MVTGVIMAEIEIIIDRMGNSKAQMTTEKGEDPACLVFDKLIQDVKKDGVVVDNVKVDVREHGHSHEFVQHKH